MLEKIRNNKVTKAICLCLSWNLLFNFFSPASLWALTSGPSQPEMAGFAPLSSDGMVDLFSGDFRYTIPLMTVPGIGGGYPITLHYNSETGMEHESSWVGMGWSLNPGAINRQVRGIPDDFRGEMVSKTYKRRNNNTFIFTPSGGLEVFGLNFGVGMSLSSSIAYNTYRGISLANRFGVSASYVRRESIEKKKDNKIVARATAGLGATFDSENGISPSFSMNGGTKDMSAGASFGYNSKSGTYSFSNQLSLSFSKTYTTKPNKRSSGGKERKAGATARMGSSFSTASHLPPIQIPMVVSTYATSFQGGGSGAYIEGHGAVAASICIQQTPPNAIKTPAFGLLYSHEARDKEFCLQDFNREKELGVDQHSLNLPLPVMTHDVYSITGEELGGSFRAYRSDLGHFFDNRVTTFSSTTDIGMDIAGGGGLQIGGTVSYNESESSTKDWSAGSYENKMRFMNTQDYSNIYSPSDNSVSPSLYEPFYFKMIGEQSATLPTHMDHIGKTEAVRFPLIKSIVISLFGTSKANYSIGKSLVNKAGTLTTIGKFAPEERSKRGYAIEYKTGTSSGKGRLSHHVSEFTVIDHDGKRFTYGDPLYNQVEREVSFSIPYQSKSDQSEPGQTLPLGNSTTINYERKHASAGTPMKERVGKERLYYALETPAYAYCYPIQHVTSADYTDCDNIPGPSDGDMGYWVKFEYKKIHTAEQPYHWRFPYLGAQLILGDNSNQQDDKGSYTYGEKEVSYLDTIITKTHIATFHTSAREDGFDVKDEIEGGMGTRQLHKLDSIRLFSREDMNTPIQTVVFQYDYSLCPKVPNSKRSGKLTLKKIYTKYHNSPKGEENGYQFSYTANKSYHPTLMDRWGNYKGDANYYNHYVTQTDKSRQDEWSQAWCMNRIDLPSGGSIQVEYESDDYAYVQDRQAMYMAKLHPITSFGKNIDGKYYVHFEKLPGGHAPSDYVKGFKHNLMLFKAAVRASGEINVSDYIQGYIKIKPNTAKEENNIIKVEVEAFPAYDIHPIYFLALQYLKNNRPDLLFDGYDADDGENDAQAFFRSLVSKGVIAKLNSMYGNDKFYNYCTKRTTFYDTLTFAADLPSYVRVNVPDKIKYGGGHRVKRIIMNDEWNLSEPSQYIQDYVYRTFDESGKLISSGVAEYEPMVGAEETALRYPVYDQHKDLFFIEDELYSEVPYGESYFPGANVGYSQVIVKTYTPPGVELSHSGIQAHRFYTAKDFPITVSETPIQVGVDPLPNVMNLITCGFKQVSSSAYSQGYQIELNDMHGKQKAVATYPYQPVNDESELTGLAEGSAPVSLIEYFYKEKRENGVRKVDNRVEVLIDDARPVTRLLGQTYDFIIDMRENYTKSTGGGLATNFMLATVAPPVPGGSATPTIDSYEETVRSVATTKVLYNTGILVKTVAINNGSKITTENKYWCPYTGGVLMSTVTNDFGKPVYSYMLPAYWQYANMGSAAENYRLNYDAGRGSSKNDISQFTRYDRIENNRITNTLDTIYWSGNTIQQKYWKSDGTSASTALSPVVVTRSGKSNQLGTMAASTVSLTDPVGKRRFPLFEAFNATEKKGECFTYLDCAGNEQYARIFYYENHFYFASGIKFHSDLCYVGIERIVAEGVYVKAHYPGLGKPQMNQFEFFKKGKTVEVYRSGRLAGTLRWSDPANLFTECQDGMLQASAVEFSPRWDYDYKETFPALASISSGKEHYLGIKNIYRPLRSNLFVTGRKQSGEAPEYKTNTAYDGTFNYFSYFNRECGNAENLQTPWTWTSEITKHSPLGFELENKDALHIHSAALFGYRNSLATAVANNAHYYEMGFDSFEDDRQGTSLTNVTRGHIRYNGGSIVETMSHTGKASLKNPQLSMTLNLVDSIPATFPANGAMCLIKGKQYVISGWLHNSNYRVGSGDSGNGYTCNIAAGGSSVTDYVARDMRIDGWERFEYVFTAPTQGNQCTINIQPFNSKIKYDSYFDDIRIHPFHAQMKSYVYNPANYRLIAELDENNYTTLYNYDEEGVLAQVKKETERGTYTLQTTRQHLKNKSPFNTGKDEK